MEASSLPSKLGNGIPVEFDGNVQYGHPNRPRNDTKYIVIHSTGANDSTARNHQKWLNSDAKANAVHFYVDSSIALQTLDLDLYAYGVGNGNNGITNGNSINIELCQSSVMRYQLKTIENTKLLIKELKKIYGDDIKVVFHKEASSWQKNCPEIIYGDKPLFSEKELRKMLDM